MFILCDCFDVADAVGGHVEAGGRSVLELKVVVSGCVVDWCLVFFVNGFRRMIQEALWKQKE